jgi:y4mF family transcriptional regulator
MFIVCTIVQNGHVWRVKPVSTENGVFTREGSFVALLAETVRYRRKALGLRQAELADLAGCSERFVHTVENGKKSLRLDKLLDVLSVLGLDLVVVRSQGPSGAVEASASPRAVE